ncbi:DUF4129 domain-containing protein [Nocardioides mesophilus]|uniref:DUF4129 domain-containing protein n=1 Tax=Nocardioides mesophilus TaxID=433659 RepID=A0A7G9R840_9ACTN|nr:DUF4129 domain-containing protein [Nocardioides mesophilus]QNN51765.1 DUF4129 domain-containing protein [Nocardioides mesophilus]
MRGQRSVRPVAALVPAVAVGLLLLVWASVSDRIAVVSPSGRKLSVNRRPVPQSYLPSPQPDPLEQARRRGEQSGLDLSWIGDLLAWAVFLAMLVLLLLLARWVWQHRWRRPPTPSQTDAEVLPEARVSRALSEDAPALLAAIGDGEVRNAIVACWARLEETIAAAGLPRLRHETSAEYVVRVLHRLDLDPRTIGRLAALYREARFSEHPMGEDARAGAREALERLHDELRQSGALR